MYVCIHTHMQVVCVCMCTHPRTHKCGMRAGGAMWWQEGVHEGKAKRDGERENEQSSDADLSHVIMKVII